MTLADNTFENNALPDNSGWPTLVLQFGAVGQISVALTRNTFANNGRSNNVTVCLLALTPPAKTPRLSIIGNTGLLPDKPSGDKAQPW